MFHPHTKNDKEAMLKAIGVKSVDDLFSAVPEEHRFPSLDLPLPRTEMEVMDEMREISRANETACQMPIFLGAGVYNHYVPAVVDTIISRGEFLTAYTPYQPEISQGTLQAIFEYQSHIVNLTGMDASNASHYDGATAAAEAVNMGQVIFRGKRKRVVISPSVHPHYRGTIETYFEGYGIDFVGEDLPADSSPLDLIELINEDTSIVLVQYPDFFGRIYDHAALVEAAHAVGALVAVVANPTALALFKSPGEFGADIVCGEGQPFGGAMSFGGPYLGILAVKQKYVRSMAGRIVGEALDTDGKRGYVLTLSTREQHIKRERASSNICSNEGLLALAASVYLSLLGKEGLKEVANLCYQKAHYGADQISALEGFELWSGEVFFHEFVVKCPKPADEINQHLLDHDIIGGYALGKDYPGMENYLMFAFTEQSSKDDIDYLVSVLAEVNNG